MSLPPQSGRPGQPDPDTSGQPQKFVPRQGAGAPVTRPEARLHEVHQPKRSAAAKNFKLDHLLALMLRNNASDLHLTVGTPIKNRVHGRLIPLEYEGHWIVCDEEDSERILLEIVTDDQREQIQKGWELDFAYQPPSLNARFRCNYLYADRKLRAVFRQIPTEIKSIDELGMPDIVRKLCTYPRGLVLVTGPTGSGKSTSLAAMIDEINRNREEHILTIEDPVEFVHRDKKCTITQREVGRDTHSFANALRAALREDPDVILVGEMRDPETISLGITAAETGHLVFATLHTQDASQTVDRLIDSFEPAQQNQIKAQLSMTLQAVISQQLLPKKDGSGRVVALEIMTATPAIRNYLREGKTEQLYSSIQTGSEAGMQTMEQSLADLVSRGVIDQSKARERATQPGELDRAVADRMRRQQGGS